VAGWIHRRRDRRVRIADPASSPRVLAGAQRCSTSGLRDGQIARLRAGDGCRAWSSRRSHRRATCVPRTKRVCAIDYARANADRSRSDAAFDAGASCASCSAQRRGRACDPEIGTVLDRAVARVLLEPPFAASADPVGSPITSSTSVLALGPDLVETCRWRTCPGVGAAFVHLRVPSYSTLMARNGY